MYRSSLLASAAVLVLALALAGASDARSPMGGPKGPHGDRSPARMIDEHADELGLDDETRQAIRVIVDESRGDSEAFHRQLRAAHDDLRDLLAQDAPDESAVMQQAETIGAVETEMHKHRLGTLLEVRALLTPEQREKLTQIRDDFRGKRRRADSEACDAEVESLCPEAGDHRARMQCLREHRDEVSEDCRASLRRGPRRDRGPGGYGDGGPGDGER